VSTAGLDNGEEWGSRTAKGEYVLKDIGEEMDAILSADAAKKEASGAPAGLVGQGLGAIGGLFRNVVGGKTLTAEDLAKPLKGMEEHLLKKNVAREAAVRLCNSVEQDLLGMKTSSFTSMYSPSLAIPHTYTTLTPPPHRHRDHHPAVHAKGPHEDPHAHVPDRPPP
jgi:signal recognition particle GTPase